MFLRVRFFPSLSTRRVAIAIVAGSLALCATQGRAAAPGFTLDAVLAAPFVDELTASLHRDALVWTVHERGARNVAVWKDGNVREITHSTDDDGQELDGVQFLPDSTAVVYARGGAGDDGDESNPNPAAPAKREPRKIFLTSLASGGTIELGNGREPAVSPKGDRVAWIGEDGQISNATIATRDRGKTWTAKKAETPFTFRGAASAPLWSPDGTRIAITNKRGDHAYIAIYTLGAPNLTFAAPAFSNDQRPVWSPTFIWERDGWRHLYSIPADGGIARPLTPGSLEIEQIALGANGNDLLYTSNEGDLDSRHIWQVPFASGERKRVSGGATNQWSPVELAGGKYAYVDASYKLPGTVTIADGAATTALLANPMPTEFLAMAASLVQPKAIVFKAPDGLMIHGQLFLAYDGRTKHPALIYVHGGPQRQMLTTFHYFEAYANLYT